MPAPAASPPTFRDRVAHVLAVWFGCGHFPKAPGTAGTVGAIPLYLLLRPHGLVAVAAAALVVTVVGIWAAGVVVDRTGLHDPQIVCIDEVAGVLVTWLAAPVGWKGLIAGFVLFRVFDQLKPWPCRASEKMPRGWGVMMDDVFAGVWGVAILLVVRHFGWL